MSPFVRKVLLFCAEKGIEIDARPIGLNSEDEEFRAASPFGKMPAMVDGDFRLADSSAILHYVEAKHPEPALIPADPEQRGRAIWFDEFADTILSACGAKLFFNRIVAPMFLKRAGDLDAALKAECEELPRILDYLESELEGRLFLVGDQLTVADISVAGSLPNLEHSGYRIDASKYPNLDRYRAALFGRPNFASLIERERAYFARHRT